MKNERAKNDFYFGCNLALFLSLSAFNIIHSIISRLLTLQLIFTAFLTAVFSKLKSKLPTNFSKFEFKKSVRLPNHGILRCFFISLILREFFSFFFV